MSAPPVPISDRSTSSIRRNGSSSRPRHAAEVPDTRTEGAFDSHGVFTPNILAHEGKYYLYYTAVRSGFNNRGYSEEAKTRIAVAVSESPDGPWTKPKNSIVIEPSEDKSRFDSFRCDDSSLLVYDGKIWLYFKGRQWRRTPKFT